MNTATLTGGFTYFEGLQITPDTGPESGGTAITILGAGFDETTTALIGDVPVDDLVLVDSATLTGTTGTSVYGTYDVVTTTGTVVTLITNGFTYTVDNTFALTSISPNYGSAVGGNTVTFTGTCFDATTTFTIGGEAVTDVVIIDSNTATGTVPAGTAGWANVAAQQGVTESTLTEAYQYIGISITAVSPSFDYVAGGAAMQITGIGFEPNATITVGGAALLSPTIVSDTVITGTVPPGSLGPANIVATKGSDSALVTDSFEYIEAFTVTSIDPDHGFVVGGTNVTITGTGFVVGTTVSIGSKPCTDISVVSSSQITATTSPNTEGPKDVVVSQLGGTATIVNGYEYIVSPATVKGDKPINDTYSGLMFLPEGLTSTYQSLQDANGAILPIAVSTAGVQVTGNFCASNQCFGYASVDENGQPKVELLTPNVPEYRDIPLSLMLGKLTPFHFGAVGHGNAYAAQDTSAFKAAASWCSENARPFHIPSSGPAAAGFYYVLNEPLTFYGTTVTSDPNAVMVWKYGDAIKIGPGGIGNYQFPCIIFSPKGTSDVDYRDLMTGYQQVNPSDPWNTAPMTGKPTMIVDNVGIALSGAFGVYVSWQYVKGFATAFKSNQSPNNVIDFIFADVMRDGIVFDGAGGAGGETVVRGSTIGVVIGNMVKIINDDSPGWSTHAVQVDIAVTWLWKQYPKTTLPSKSVTNNRIFSANNTAKKYNKVNVTNVHYQDILT